LTQDQGEVPLTRNGGSRPIPDPTELTDRAIARLERSLTQYIDGRFSAVEARLDGVDEATRLRLSTVDSLHDEIIGEIESSVGRLRDVMDERFTSVNIRFDERDTRSERESRDNKVAVDAAFAAQKEAAAKQDEANAKAIDKSERATTETIKTNQELNKATTDVLTKGLDEVKLAVAGIVAGKAGGADSRTATYTLIGLIVTVVLGVIAVIAFARPAVP
jgi:hypothetical protein